ncbi:MAG: CDP-glucose 4,6-dehydratase [Lachnospiraceae bacterium]|nr:CDP-glucose 4,6-dehydratase [Lachnospiraceae bacterium]
MFAGYYRKKRILVTGDTGFKGSMLCRILSMYGAEVVGYAMSPPTEPSLYEILHVSDSIHHVEGDIRDYAKLRSVVEQLQPEIVFHLAAQPIVRESYRDPIYTYETNVMGTVHVCECIRNSKSVRSFLNVTTDKVYENEDLGIAFSEDMPLDGHDPYSNSKSCSELVTHSYTKSFLKEKGVAVSTARAGNVIGGGDFAKDRIIPDCVRAATAGKDILVRNPHSIRPYQHVLEPLYVYLLIAMEQEQHPDRQGSYNVGPDDSNCITTGELAELFCACWGEGIGWSSRQEQGPHEAGFLKLDCSKLKDTFAWQPRWNVKETVHRTVEWYKAYFNAEDMQGITNRQIGEMFDV